MRWRRRWNSGESRSGTSWLPANVTATTVPSMPVDSIAACSAAEVPLASTDTSAPRPAVSSRIAAGASRGCTAASAPHSRASSQARLQRVDDDHRPGGRARELRAQAADDAHAVHHDRVADPDRHVVDGVDRHVDEVGEHRPLGRQAVRDREHQRGVVAHDEAVLVRVADEHEVALGVARARPRLLDAADDLVGVLDRVVEAVLGGQQVERRLAAVDEHLGAGADQRHDAVHEQLAVAGRADRLRPQLRVARPGEPERPRGPGAHGYGGADGHGADRKLRPDLCD